MADVSVLAYTYDGVSGLGSVTFYVGNISRVCSHQLVRYRTASFAQESQRYVRVGEFVLPEVFIDNSTVADAVVASFAVYQDLLSQGFRKEDARYVLPNAARTNLVVTFTLRSFENFLRQRLDSAAQAEIRFLAVKMLCLVQDLPFADLFAAYLADNACGC